MKTTLYKSLLFVIFSLFVVGKVNVVNAQVGITPSPSDDVEDRLQLTTPDIDLNQIVSLFLTPSEITLLSEAKKGFFTRPPTEREINKEQSNAVKGMVNFPDSVREVALGGILYNASNDWTIWLNSEKITPKNIPPAIIDISVTKDHVKMKWLDFQTNQIFPVKLRANQRFNFDTKIFLPG